MQLDAERRRSKVRPLVGCDPAKCSQIRRIDPPLGHAFDALQCQLRSAADRRARQQIAGKDPQRLFCIRVQGDGIPSGRAHHGGRVAPQGARLSLRQHESAQRVPLNPLCIEELSLGLRQKPMHAH